MANAFEDDRAKIAWLYRRVGFGIAPGQLDQVAPLGVTGVLDQLLDPDVHGVAVAPDPWEGIDLPLDLDGQGPRDSRVKVVTSWVTAMARTPRPLEEWMRWFWHGHFVSTIRVVKSPALMVQQARLLGDQGLGGFGSLVKEVTVDPAMLIYLDGRTNRKAAVNENYGREVLELFTLGIGNYTEADVRAGAEALTGWRIDRPTGSARFFPGTHDDRPHTYLGVTGVHDVDTVVAAILNHEACAPFITRKLCRAILGPDVDDGLVGSLASQFRSDGYEIRPLVRRILEAGLDGASTPMVWAPVPWYAAMVRAAGIDATKVNDAAGRQLIAAGQVPMDAPNVAGWPGGRSWLTSATTLARCSIASGLAEYADANGPVVQAAGRRDWRTVADALGRPEGFSRSTIDALSSLGTGRNQMRAALTVAMACPDVVVA